MIQNIIFDLDGVLVKTKDLHYEALNLALPTQYQISREDHYNRFDGLSTDTKLKILTKERELPSGMHDSIKKLKQENTIKLIDSRIQFNEEIFKTVRDLFSEYQLYCASNAVPDTVVGCLNKLHIKPFFRKIYSNNDVKYPKPHPEIYLRCMADNHLHPKETLIIEDSINGKKAAIDSGANVMSVYSPKDVHFIKIRRYINSLEGSKMKWKDSKLNVVIPMAGHGSRFAAAGYTFPKPLIDVNGKPMIQLVVENLNIDAHYIFIVQKEHNQKYNISHLLHLLAPNCDIVEIDGVTEGAACSVLLARDYINNDNPLLIANSDQFVEWDSSKFMYHMINKDVDGGILTFKSMHPKWSFARVENGKVVEVAEKKPISDIATVGINYYKRGRDFCKYANSMIANNIRVNNEFYVCPVFNEFIRDGKTVIIYDAQAMWGLGTPEDLERFLKEYK